MKNKMKIAVAITLFFIVLGFICSVITIFILDERSFLNYSMLLVNSLGLIFVGWLSVKTFGNLE